MPTYNGKEVRVTCKGAHTCNIVYVETGAVAVGILKSEVIEKKAPESPPIFKTKKERNKYFNQKED